MNGLPFIFANPWGALALLGLPAVVAIHCLQQKARILNVSTLFLLERLAPDSKEGRRLTWLRQSIPFWLQIFCVLLLTWILLDPRWLRADAVQRIVVVLDSSISMRAFTGDLVTRVSPRLDQLSALTPRTYWTLLETDPARPTLYEGLDLKALKEKMRVWLPAMPAHDPTHALSLARALAPRDALVVFVSDRPHEVQGGIDLLAVGEPIENCGMVGSRLLGTGDTLEWQVIVQNYGKQTAHRTWWIEIAGQKTSPETLDLEPDHPKILKGKFPPNVNQIEVCLDPDRFTVDDRMPLIRPQPKRLTVDLLGDGTTMDLFVRLTQIIPSLAAGQSGQSADLALITADPHALIPKSAGSSIVLFHNPAPSSSSLQGEPFVVESDPLNQDLNWQALIMQPGAPLKPDPADHVLLWKDQTPIILVRSLTGDRRQLIFNFDFPTSNATRLPAFILLMSRFVESIRTDKVAPESRNVELAEMLGIAANSPGGPVILHDDGDAEISLPARPVMNFRAPTLPGFFTVTQDGKPLLTGAARFADARESDFATASTADTLAVRHAKLVEEHAEAESFTPLWLILIGLLLALNWRATNPRAA